MSGDVRRLAKNVIDEMYKALDFEKYCWGFRLRSNEEVQRVRGQAVMTAIDNIEYVLMGLSEELNLPYPPRNPRDLRLVVNKK
jgi:hypothetical protein